MAFCRECGTKLDGDFCGSCGAPSGAAARVYRHEPSPTVEPRRNARSDYPTANINVRTGEACPKCFETLYSKHYTFWHIAFAILAFPLGLLILLVPARRCPNGHEYGTGVSIIRWLQVGIVMVIAFFFFLFVEFHRHSPSQYPYSSSANGVQNPDSSAPRDVTQSQATVGPEPESSPNKSIQSPQPPLHESLQSSEPTGASPQSASAAVVEYYYLWNYRNYVKMYGMLSPAFQKAHPFNQYRRYHDSTDHINADVTPLSDPSRVMVHIVSEDHDAKGIKTESVFNGTWQLVAIHGSWKLNHEELTEVSARLLREQLTETGTGNNAGTSASSGAIAPAQIETPALPPSPHGGTGHSAVNANTPCGFVEFLPTEPPHYSNGTATETIRAKVTFPDGHAESVSFPYKWVYPNGEQTDPWSATNSRKGNFPVTLQTPPPGSDLGLFPLLVQYILKHSDSSGYTDLPDCPKSRG